MSNLKLADAADCLEGLGNPTRLAIFRLLVRSGPQGLPVGRIRSRLAIPGSTLSHHIAQLEGTGLIDRHREGRTLRCLPNYAKMNAVIEFLTDECCLDAGDCP